MEVTVKPRWFGIDVSKDTFDVAIFPGEARKGPHIKLPRTRSGCKECLRWVDRMVPEGKEPALVMEATGSYGKEMAEWLLALREEVLVAIAQPWRVRQGAKAEGGFSPPSDGPWCWPGGGGNIDGGVWRPERLPPPQGSSSFRWHRPWLG